MQTDNYEVSMHDKWVTTNIDTWLTDNEVNPKPIMPLIDYPNHYWAQLINCAPHWEADERLTVASMLIGQPLKVQGAIDAVFYLPDYVPAEVIINWTSSIVNIQIIGGEIGDTYRPAREGWARLINKLDEDGLTVGDAKWIFELKDSWIEMYMFIHNISRNGTIENLNSYSALMPTMTFQDLNITQRQAINEAKATLLKAEGNDG